MTRRVASSVLVDANGYPIRYVFFQGAATARNGDAARTAVYLGDQDTHKLLGTFGIDQLRRNGRLLFANVPMVRGALLEQANWSFPLDPQYVGTDTAWGDLAAEWLYNWDTDPTLRGFPFDQPTCARIRMLGRKVDGDILVNAVEDPDTQYPRVQLIRGHRIGERQPFVTDQLRLTKGPFKGLFSTAGIVYDQFGRTRGYHILGNTEDEDQWLDAAQCRLVFRPDYSDLLRGLSELVASIASMDDLRRLNDYEMRAQQAFSSIALMEKNETGFADETADAINRAVTTITNDDGTTTEKTLVTEEFEGGAIRYFRSGTGSGLEAFRGDRPSPDSAAYEERIVRRALYGIEWDADFALALKEPGGAWARTILQKVNRAILNNQSIEAQTLLWIHTRALARAVYELKVLPPPKDGDIFSWNYRGPARITADSGNEESAKRNNYILGTLTLRDWASERGQWWTEIRRQREAEVKDKLVRARALLEEFPELGSIQLALKLIEDTAPMVKFDATPANTADAEVSGAEPMNGGNGGNGGGNGGQQEDKPQEESK